MCIVEKGLPRVYRIVGVRDNKDDLLSTLFTGTYSSNINTMKYIKKLLKQVIWESLEEMMPRIVRQASIESHHGLFAYIGIQRLEKMIEDAKKRDEKYVALSEMFAQIMRDNLAKENSEIVHSYFELLRPLNQYTKQVGKKVEQD